MLNSPNTQSSVGSNTSDEVSELIELDPRVREKDGPFEFWYRLTAPSRQPLSASFELREAARQGRLTSTVLAMVAGSLIILAIPTSFATNNPTLLGVLCVLLSFVSVALFLNRIGKGFVGRLLVVIAMNASLAVSLITWPGGLTPNTLPIFDILVVEPILVTLALLPPGSVFIVALCNAAFIGLDFYLEPHSADFTKLLAVDGYEVVTRPLYLLIFVVGVVYPVMRSVLRSIALSDRAKEIAKVQRDLAHREALVVQEKQILDEDIRLLVDALTQMANGNIRTNVPFPTSQSLWPITGVVKNLYARVRSSRQVEYELQHTKASAAALIKAIHLSKQNHQDLQIERNGNPIVDAIILELLTDRPTTTRPLLQDMTTGFMRRARTRPDVER
jgi:hypothetical protein